MVYKWVGYEATGLRLNILGERGIGVGRSTVKGSGMVVKTTSKSCCGIITEWALGRLETCEDSKTAGSAKRTTRDDTPAANRGFWNGDAAASSLPNCAKGHNIFPRASKDRSG